MMTEAMEVGAGQVMGVVPGTDIPIVAMRPRWWTAVEVVLAVEGEVVGRVVDAGLTAGERVAGCVEVLVENPQWWRWAGERDEAGWTRAAFHLLLLQADAERLLEWQDEVALRGWLWGALWEFNWLLLGTRLAGVGERGVQRRAVDVATVRAAEAAMAEVVAKEGATMRAPLLGEIGG